MSTDSKMAAWTAVDKLLDRRLPNDPDGRWLLDDAITALVTEAEKSAIQRHGRQIIDVVFGEHFQVVQEELDQWTPTI